MWLADRFSKARVVALDWDQREARLAIAAIRDGSLRLEHAMRVPLPQNEGDPLAVAAERGELVRTALAACRVRRARLLVGVGRASVDLRQLTLPPAPDDDLPVLVQHQVMRELGSNAVDSPLDFIALGTDPSEPRTVVAVSLPAEQLQAVEATCDAAGIQPKRILLRSYASAELAAPAEPTELSTCILVDASPSDADLTVISGGQVVFSRSVRLPAPQPDETQNAPLVAEIRRTIVAVANQLSGQRVEEVLVCGPESEQQSLLTELAAELELPAKALDPFESIPIDPHLVGHLPHDRGRFASVLGMLVGESRGAQHAVDFLNPKRPPKQTNHRRRNLIVAAAAAALLLGVAMFYAHGVFSEIDEEIERLNAQSRQLDSLVKRAEAKQEAVAAIEQWAGGEVLWLDELRDLSSRFPKRRDAVLSRLTLGRAPAGGGVIDLQGQVRDPAIVGRMETKFRDAHHEVRSKRVQESVQGKTFTWQFESSLSVSHRDKSDYVESALAAQPIALPRPAESTDASPNERTPSRATATQ